MSINDLVLNKPMKRNPVRGGMAFVLDTEKAKAQLADYAPVLAGLSDEAVEKIYSMLYDAFAEGGQDAINGELYTLYPKPHRSATTAAI